MAKFPVAAASATSVTLDGREVLAFGGCNYLGLGWHPAVHGALVRGLQQYGLSTSASRETTGNTLAHDRLERELASFLGTEDGVVVPDGYTANLAIAETIAKEMTTSAGTRPVAIVDRRSHRSIREAITGSGMDLVEFEHLNHEQAAGAIAMQAALGRPMVVFTDGVFTAEGAIAPVRELLAALPAKGAVLVVDDCHGFCTMGPGGAGTLSELGIDPADARIIITTTLAKGLGCHGGVIAGSAAWCGKVRARGSAYICTTPVSPAIATAAVTALDIVTREPGRVQRLRQNAASLKAGLRGLGLRLIETPAPIAAFLLESETLMRRVHAELLAEGILAPLIAYPGGPAACYFRVSITCEHTAEQIERLIAALGSKLEAAREASVAAA